MIFPQFVIYVLMYNYLEFRKDPSITSQEIANYISVALAVALSVDNHRILFAESLFLRSVVIFKFRLLFNSSSTIGAPTIWRLALVETQVSLVNHQVLFAVRMKKA